MKERFSLVLSGLSFLCMMGSLTCREGPLSGVECLYEVFGRLIDESVSVHLSE